MRLFMPVGLNSQRYTVTNARSRLARGHRPTRKEAKINRNETSFDVRHVKAHERSIESAVIGLPANAKPTGGVDRYSNRAVVIQFDRGTQQCAVRNTKPRKVSTSALKTAQTCADASVKTSIGLQHIDT